jgi:hypothetical protein
MKSILLTTTALVAFAGAAAADGHAGISFSGSATLGYNDYDNPAVGSVNINQNVNFYPTGTTGSGSLTGFSTTTTTTTTSDDDNTGFYGDLELDVTMTAALDNGITVTASADIGDLDAADAGMGGVTLEIASEMASLTFGDTDPSADKHWSGVDGDTVGDFRGATEHEGAFDAILRGEASMAGVTASISYGVNMQGSSDPDFGALQVAAVADVSGFTVVGAYEAADADFGPGAGLDQQYGVSVAGAVAGVDVKVAYSAAPDDNNVSSLGLSASMPFGPVTVGGYYSVNSGDTAAAANDKYGLDVSYSDGPISISADFDTDADDATDPTWEIDANYDTGLGAIIHAGMVDSGEDYYVAGTYDLGGGASLLVSYVVDGDDDNSDDEIGEDDLQAGTTVEVSFSF